MGSAEDARRDLYETVRLVRPIHLNVHRFVEHLLADGDMTVAKRAVLEAVIDLDAATAAELGRHLSLKRQQVERVIRPLVEDGLVSDRPDRADRRARRWYATDRGRHVFTSIHRAEVDAVADMFRDIDPAEIAVAARVMAAIDERFRAAMYEIDHATATR